MSDMPRETLTVTREPLTGGMPPRDLGSGEVEKMFGPAPTPRQRLEAQGIKFVESETEMGGGGDVSEAEIRSELQKYERNWDTKLEADKDKFFPAWEMVLKARLGSKSAEKWCQDNKLALDLHGEVFMRLAARRREEKMTIAEKAQGLTGGFLIFREALPHLLGNKELVDKRAILAPQQGGQNAAKP